MNRFKEIFHSRRKEYALVLLFFFIIAVIFTWPLILHFHNGVIGGSSDPLLNTWIITWDAKTTFTNPTGLFQGNIMYPCRDVLVYSEHLFTMGIIAAPVYFLSRNPILSYNFLIFFGFILSALGCYILVKELTGSRWGGLVAGIFFAFCPFKMSKLMRIHVFFSPFLPFMLLYLYRFFCKGRKRYLVLFGFFFLAQSLCSWHYLVYSTLAAGLLWMWFALFSRKKEEWLRLALVVLAVAIVAALMVPFALPYFRAHQRLPGFERSLEDAEYGSASLEDYLTVLPKHVLYGRLIPPPLRISEMEMESVLFPGLIVILLALAGLFIRRRDGDTTLAFNPISFRKGACYFLILTIIGTIMTFGPKIGGVQNPFYVVAYHLGFLKFNRGPSRFFVLVALGLAVLAGYGIAKISIRYSQWRKDLSAGRMLAAAIVLLLLIELGTFNFNITGVPVYGDVPEVYSWLEEQGDVRIIELPTSTTGIPIQGMPIYLSTYHWKETANGYSGYNPYFTKRIFSEVADFPSERSLDLLRGLGIDYVIWHWDWVDAEKRQLYSELLRSTQGLEMVKDYGDEVVYRLMDGKTASPDDLNISFEIPEEFMAGEDLDARLIICNESDQPWVMAEEDPQPLLLRLLDEEGNLVEEITGEYRVPFFLENGECTVTKLEGMVTPGTGTYEIELILTTGILGNRRFKRQIEIL